MGNIHWKCNLFLIRNSSSPNIDWKFHVLLYCSAIIRFGPRFSQGPMPKHDASLKGKGFCWITSPKHEGTFGGVADSCDIWGRFASASVKEQHQVGI